MKVICCGAFDLMHPGHIYLLNKCKKYGEVVVTLSLDKMVGRTKRNPILSQKQRKYMLENLKCVDKIILEENKRVPFNIINILKKENPDVVILGEDNSNFKEYKKLCKEMGIRFIRIKRNNKEIFNVSTSKIMDKIKMNDLTMKNYKMAKGNQVIEVPKVWGKEIWMANNELYCGKKLYVTKGKRGSLHFHKNKDESFYIEKGKILLEIKNKKILMNEGDTIRIPRNTIHRYSGLKDSVIIETSTHHEDSDSYRKEISGDIPKSIMKKYSQKITDRKIKK